MPNWDEIWVSNDHLYTVFYIKEMQLYKFLGILSICVPVNNQGIGNLQHFSTNLEVI